MKIVPVLMLGLACTFCCFTLFSCTRSFAQSAAAAPLHYAFSESFETKFWPDVAGGFRARGIAVDDGGQIYLTADDEGIVQFDAHRKYRFSFGFPAPEEERAGVDQNGNPETNEDMSLGQRAYLRSADGQPFVVMPDAKTLSIAGHLFQPAPVMINGAGQLCTVDNMTDWFQAFTGNGPASYYEIPSVGHGMHKFTGLAQGFAYRSDPNAPRKNVMFYLDASARQVLVVDFDANLIKSFGGAGSGSGELLNPTALAISPENTLFVGDGSRVMVYRADGTWLYAFGSPGGKPGQFAAITAVAVSKAGHVFVLDGRRLQAFTEQGDYLGLVAAAETAPFGSGGGGGLRGAQAVTVDKSETIYLVDQGWVKVYKPYH